MYTSLDVDLQAAANRALDDGLRQLDKRRGFRKPRRNLLAEGRAIDQYRDDAWDGPIAVGQVVPAVVVAVGGAPAAARRGCASAATRPTLGARRRSAWTGAWTVAPPTS